MFKTVAILSLAVGSAYGHAFINAVQGANGLTATGFGVDTTGAIPRNGTTEQPFQVDTPVLKNLKDDPCGATLQSGSINMATAMAAALKANNNQLPTIPTNGLLTLGIHQVNADGGGPFVAEVNTDGTGKTWTAVTVTSQPPGINGLLHNGPADSKITLQLPNTLACTGGSTGNACVIRLNNGGANTGSIANGAGPFGGCVAVSQANAAATGAAATGAAANATTGAAATTGKTAGKAGGKTAAATGGKAAAGGKVAATAGKAAKGAKAAREVVRSRHFFPSLSARRQAIDDLVAKREAMDAEILAKRQKLTAQLIDELKTATGTAIDIPIDALAGHVDESALGGNSTKAAGALLTDQQAVDIKKAVQNAIEQAFIIMASTQVDAGANGQAEAVTDKANADADAAFKAGQIKSVNAGNAGVGEPNTAVINSLLGGIATATADLAGGAGAAATITSAPPASTAATGGKKTGGKVAAGVGKGVGAAAGAKTNAAAGAKGGKSRFARDSY
ncbi:CRISPR-associated protein 1 [Heterobasidion irregulare TC 32-1]|uniref:CRISPR-associated protein 1 n=1 Tax=Heterobasidion irregulare (strain TC 32-1) TaxID=747525 RepID=W4K6H2_HETIT|nr:CRISPR-associated protein 1 [Heterobasidion irregulare TC 32-1]ETW81403.1 CRISPR-associated protein 1 [Heterobasidion irregulare TC 32-1]